MGGEAAGVGPATHRVATDAEQLGDIADSQPGAPRESFFVSDLLLFHSHPLSRVWR
jgi:hypothetical protein